MSNKLTVFDSIIAFVKYLGAEKSSASAVKNMVKASAISNASLASRARLNVCQFPLLTSSTVSVSTYQKTAEILEQLYAQYLKLVIVNQLEVINLEKDNKLSIVAKVHQNDNAMASNTDIARDNALRADVAGRFSEDMEFLNELREALSFLEVTDFPEHALKEANKQLLKEYSENFNYTNLNTCQLSESTKTVDEEINSKYNHLKNLEAEERSIRSHIRYWQNKLDASSSDNEKERAKFAIKNLETRLERVKDEMASIMRIIKTLSDKKTLDDRERAYAKEKEKEHEAHERELAKEEREKRRFEFEMEKAQNKEARDQEKFELEKREKEREQREKEEKAKFRKAFGSVTDFDNALIRKNNQLEPSILSFTMKYHTKSGSFEDTKVALAVKTITHLIQSDELAYYINETLTKDRKVFRAIQLLTGERDFSWRFLFHLDKAKRDARADNSAVKWWRHLKDRRAASWLNAARGNDPFVPNATIVMSYEDYECLKLMYKKDIVKDTKLAWKLTDHLFLMHLVIVNDVNNELMIFNKDDRNWETYTLDKLQTEINTINKMSNQKTLR